MEDLYEADIDWNECNLLDGTDNKGIRTKLWMTDCGHIICYKHLPGGLVPFHPQHNHPRINCPICPSKHDTNLFWIRGRDHWQHDQSIPSECFQETVSDTLKQTSPEVFALAMHYHGAKASAKLHAAQTQIATNLLHKSEQRILLLEQENTILESKIRDQRPMRSPVSIKGLMLPPARPPPTLSIMSATDIGRVTLKRGHPTSLPEIKNFRRCLPARGVLHGYGTTDQDTLRGHESVGRLESMDLDLDNLPAFSTPCLRSNLSPMKRPVWTPSTMSVVRYGRVDRTPVQNYGAGMQLDVRRFARGAYGEI